MRAGHLATGSGQLRRNHIQLLIKLVDVRHVFGNQFFCIVAGFPGLIDRAAQQLHPVVDLPVHIGGADAQLGDVHQLAGLLPHNTGSRSGIDYNIFKKTHITFLLYLMVSF